MTDPAVATDSYAENMRRQGHTAALIAAYLVLVAALRAATSIEDIQAAVKRDIPPLAAAIDAYVQQQTGLDALGHERVNVEQQLSDAVTQYGGTAMREQAPSSIPDYLALVAAAETQRAIASATQDAIANAPAGSTLHRIAQPGACDLCKSLAGEYTAPYPDDVWTTHPHCCCVWQTTPAAKTAATIGGRMAIKFADASRTALDIRLVPFGGSIKGKDSSGEYFSAKTDLCLDWYPDRRPLLYQHGLDRDIKAVPVGYITSIEVKADGAWAKAQLDKRHEYYSEIVDLIDQEALGASSGAMGHLVRKNRKTGHIDVWPLCEGSMTPTPCEPLLATVDWDTAKSHFKAIGVELPETLHSGIKAPLEQGNGDGEPIVPNKPEHYNDYPYLHSENGKYYGLYRDTTGTVDLALLQNAIQQVQDSDLPDDTKERVLARARAIAIQYGMSTVVTLTDGSGKSAALKATWTAAFVNDLPDSSFLYVEPGGKKDGDGKTTPRSLRHFPVKGSDGTVDLPHLRNALARIPQSSLPDTVKARVQRAAQRLAKDNGIDSDSSKSAPMGPVSDYDGSYEELIEDLRTLLNPRTPWAMSGWTGIVATYPDYVIACRCDDNGDGDPTYWHIQYDLSDDGDPVLGTATEVMQTWVPAKTQTTEGPLYLDVQALIRDARAVEQRTEGLFDRRVKEGRVLSAANMKMLAELSGTLTDVAAKIGDLLESSNRTGQEQAKAAFLASPEYLRTQLNLLQLAASIPDLHA